MYKPSSSTLPVTLLSFLLLSPVPIVCAISDRSICVRQNAPILAQAAACGDRLSLQNCLVEAPAFVTLDDLQRCFIDANCTIPEATIEATIILENCDASSLVPELRRRGPEAMPAATPAPQSTQTSESTSPATVTTTLPTTPTECSTAHTFKTTICPISSLSKDIVTKLPCTTSTATTQACAATNICFADGTCAYRTTTLSQSGVIVTVVLALAIVAVIATLLFFYARDRAARRLAREKAEADRREKEQKASDESLRRFAKMQVERERLRRQRMEARDWALRRAMEGRREENPFEEGVVSSAA
ncbi:hypothetical protein GGS24DRAFT_330831 [Hypoxylon argillaceum]|nr:hypothetical protein GGS24DRAFT_330831 [Hypoxylon argillaceum]